MTNPDPQDHPEDAAPQDAAPEGAEAAPPGPDARLAALEQQLAEANDKMLRALAEAENVRRRAAREREDTAKYAISGFARDVLTVTDNLRRAMDAVSPEAREANAELKNIHTGLEMTERALLRELEKNGIRKVDPAGEAFDPNLHEVMFETDAPGAAPGTVVQVVEPGDVIHERLLRPARVGVAKGAAAPQGVDEQV